VTKPAVQGRAKRRFGGYLAGLFAAVTCPCHIPLYAILLSGTAVGSWLTPTRPATLMLFTVVFLLFAVTAVRLLK